MTIFNFWLRGRSSTNRLLVAVFKSCSITVSSVPFLNLNSGRSISKQVIRGALITLRVIATRFQFPKQEKTQLPIWDAVFLISCTENDINCFSQNTVSCLSNNHFHQEDTNRLRIFSLFSKKLYLRQGK